jgi:two-component system NtrC family sensor kinase
MASFRLDLVFVFFVYGLAFFSMGIALSLESFRSPMFVGRLGLILLATFGLIHGIHEWLEVILLQGIWLGAFSSPVLSSLRVAILGVSFIPLLSFGVLTLATATRYKNTIYCLGVGFLVVFGAMAVYNARLDPEHASQRIDVLARYWLAIPGGILAGLAIPCRRSLCT